MIKPSDEYYEAISFGESESVYMKAQDQMNTGLNFGGREPSA